MCLSVCWFFVYLSVGFCLSSCLSVFVWRVLSCLLVPSPFFSPFTPLPIHPFSFSILFLPLQTRTFSTSSILFRLIRSLDYDFGRPHLQLIHPFLIRLCFFVHLTLSVSILRHEGKLGLRTASYPVARFLFISTPFIGLGFSLLSGFNFFGRVLFLCKYLMRIWRGNLFRCVYASL